MANQLKQELKIQLFGHEQFQTAWDLLIKMGYHCEETPFSAQYLYCYADGRIGVDYFDSEGVEASDPNSTLTYFNNHNNKEVSLVELIEIEKQHAHESLQALISLTKIERPLFEANYIATGGNINFLKWDECSDGTGSYSADWEAINDADIDDSAFDEQIQEHAFHVTGCLHSWVQCAKAKAIPEGFYLMPTQPDQEMIAEAEKEFNDLEIEDIQDRIVFSHQAMIQVLSLKNQA